MKKIFAILIVLSITLVGFSKLVYSEYDPNYPDLQVWNPAHPYEDKFVDSFSVNQQETNLLPGNTKQYSIKLTNRSYGGTLPLTITINFSSLNAQNLGSGMDYFKVRLTDIAANISTPWLTFHQLLQDSNYNPSFPELVQNEVKEYKIEFQMDPYSPGELQNLNINDMQVTIYGTSGNYQDSAVVSGFGFTTGSYVPVEPPAPTPTPTATPTSPTLPAKDWILLIPLCSSKPNQFRIWKAVNLTNTPLTVNWSVPKISKSGAVNLPPKENVYFKVDGYKNINTTVFSWNNHSITLYSLPLFCRYDFLK